LEFASCAATSAACGAAFCAASCAAAFAALEVTTCAASCATPHAATSATSVAAAHAASHAASGAAAHAASYSFSSPHPGSKEASTAGGFSRTSITTPATNDAAHGSTSAAPCSPANAATRIVVETAFHAASQQSARAATIGPTATTFIGTTTATIPSFACNEAV